MWLNGYVNKQNCRFWSEDQAEELQKLPIHPGKKSQFGAVHGMDASFFKDAANRIVTVNGERYREMISNYF